MRHIFYVQSNLSSLVCQAIAHYRNLSPSDILFVIDRGAPSPHGFPFVIAHKRLRAPLRDSFRHILDNRKVRSELYSLFTDYAEGHDFEIYVNRMNYPFLEIAESHSSWKKTHIYEEGLASYYREIGSSSMQHDISFLKKLRLRLIRGLSGYEFIKAFRTFYNTKYSYVFATSIRAFANFPRRVIVDLKKTLSVPENNMQIINALPNALILVMPLHNAFSNDDPAKYRLLAALSGIIKYYPNRPILIKPHPDHFSDQSFWDKFYADLEKLVGRDLTKNVCHDLPLEQLAFTRQDLIFCVVVSSLGAYAHIFLSTVISVAPFVFGDDHPLVKTFMSVSPGIMTLDNSGEKTYDSAKFAPRHQVE